MIIANCFVLLLLSEVTEERVESGGLFVDVFDDDLLLFDVKKRRKRDGEL
jgi:hypothetical protein